jgi:Polyketide cyclase / dehydrase and lipid transport
VAKAIRTAVIEAPIEKVWETVRPFDGLPAWHPLCPDTHIEGGGSPLAVGSIRNIKQTDGNEFRERLLAISDIEHSKTYALLEPPDSVSSMVTTMRLYPIGDGDETYLSWSSEIAAEKKEDETSFVGFVEDSYMIGIRSLQKIFGGGAEAA